MVLIKYALACIIKITDKIALMLLNSAHNIKSATVFVVLNHFSSQLIRLIGNLILTRLLAPELFGVMAFVFTIITALHMISDLGVNQAVVRSNNSTNEKFLKVAWTIKLIHGIFIAVVLILFGVILKIMQINFENIESAFSYPDLPYVLFIIALTPILTALSSIRIVDYLRQIKQKELFVLEFVSQVSSMILMILMAYLFSSIYALVFGSIFAAMLKCILSYLYLKGAKSGICFQKEYFTEIVSFGKWIVVSSITGFIVNSGDKILLGFWVSASQLGFYSIAQILSHFVKQMVQKLMSSLYFPVLSAEVKSDRGVEKIKQKYYSIRFRIDLITCLSVGFVFSTSETIVNLLYDDRYVEVATILKILAFSSVWVGGQLATQLFLAYGKSKLLSNVMVYQALVFILITPLFYYLFGFYGVIVSVVINPAIQYGFSCFYMKKYFFIDYYRELVGLAFIPIGMLLGELFNLLYDFLFLNIIGVA